MRQTEIELLMSYIVNEEARIENDLIELRNRIRFRRIDVTDCVEFMLTLQRLEAFREFSLTVILLLNLGR